MCVYFWRGNRYTCMKKLYCNNKNGRFYKFYDIMGYLYLCTIQVWTNTGDGYHRRRSQRHSVFANPRGCYAWTGERQMTRNYSTIFIYCKSKIRKRLRSSYRLVFKYFIWKSYSQVKGRQSNVYNKKSPVRSRIRYCWKSIFFSNLYTYDIRRSGRKSRVVKNHA